MGSVGLPELIIIFTIALIVFGPRKLPELGKSLGKSIAEFKRASNELKNTLDEEIRSEERKSVAAQLPPAPAPVPQLQEASRTFDAPVPQNELTGTDDPHASVPRQNGSA
jgi:sec-independent protein translocase protein TatA